MKKLPKWVIPVVAAGLLAVIVLRKKQSAGTKATEVGSEGLTNQSFIPVTGENVAGVGAANYAAAEQSSNLQSIFTQEQQRTQEYMKEQRQEQKETTEQFVRQGQEQREAERNWIQELISTLRTGGGAPSTPAGGGSTPVPPPPTQTPTPPPAPPPYTPPPAPAPPANPCHNPAFPNPGPHGCWRWSRTKTGSGCSCHGYENGVLECEHIANGRCTF
jgi:hypothetical protein